MIIQLKPQGRKYNKIWYEITENKITAAINDVTDTFDFTDMSNGVLQVRDDEGNSLIETTLDEIPILSARKEDGILYVEILFSIDMREQDERLLFPNPMTLDEFQELMDEISERDKGDEDNGENGLENGTGD